MVYVYALVESVQVRYVGYTARIGKRRRHHANTHPAWSFLVLGAYPTQHIGLEQERRWIRRLLDAGHSLINISDGGTYSIPGRSISELTRARMSAARKGKTHPGHPISVKNRAALSRAVIGVHKSAEHKTKLSLAMTGRRHTPEAIAKMVAAHTGRKHTMETRAKMSATHRARRGT